MKKWSGGEEFALVLLEVDRSVGNVALMLHEARPRMPHRKREDLIRRIGWEAMQTWGIDSATERQKAVAWHYLCELHPDGNRPKAGKRTFKAREATRRWAIEHGLVADEHPRRAWLREAGVKLRDQPEHRHRRLRARVFAQWGGEPPLLVLDRGYRSAEHRAMAAPDLEQVWQATCVGAEVWIEMEDELGRGLTGKALRATAGFPVAPRRPVWA